MRKRFGVAIRLLIPRFANAVLTSERLFNVIIYIYNRKIILKVSLQLAPVAGTSRRGEEVIFSYKVH